MLKTETNTPAMERRIRSAFDSCDLNTSCKFETHFEHGQWWITTTEPLDSDITEKTFSVVDAEPRVKHSGLDFEEVS